MTRRLGLPFLALAALCLTPLLLAGGAHAVATAEIGGSPAPADTTPPPPATGGNFVLTPVEGDASLAPEAIVWSDSFDSYATGSQLHGQGGWKGWDNSPAGGALASSAQFTSPPNSAEIVGASDLVHEYSGATSGPFAYIAWQYVPASMTGTTYFILLNTYNDGGPYNWSVQVEFNGATNQVVNTGVSGGTLPLIRGQWVQLRVEIDLTADTQSFFYNNALLYQGSWTGEISGGGALEIAAVDLFANGASAVYYDDMVLASGAAELTLAKTVGTVPGVCALTSEITVPAGTAVHYCYVVTNIGSVTLNLHDLVDSELGVLASGIPYALAPGSSAYGFVPDIVIDVTTTNVATWTAYNVGGASAQATATATVYVEETGSVLEIPTLSTLGIGLLALALAGLAVTLLRRRAA